MKMLGKLQKINWGETILIRDYDKFECHVNPFGNSSAGIPTADHTEIAEMIVNIFNEHEELEKCCISILTNLETNKMRGNLLKQQEIDAAIRMLQFALKIN